ncbi:MAG TPA: Hsp20/alpha crystallin family protein [Candidatus Paceibacterota bacterium]
MDPNEEKFFENLARGRKVEVEIEEPEDEAPEVELTKASLPTLTHEKNVKKMETEDLVNSEPEGQLTIDVYQTPEDIVVESAIAGVKPEDIDIDVTSDSVTIRGARGREHKVKDEDYFYQECYWGRFSRSIILPQEIDPENATVLFKNGILTVHLPKLVRRKSRKLKVKFE